MRKIFVLALLAGCATPKNEAQSARGDGAPDATMSTAAVTESADAGVTAKAATHAAAPIPEAPGEYLQAHLPSGGSYEDGHLFHTVTKGDTAASIAATYLALTETYYPADLATAIAKTNKSLAVGKKIEIPAALTHAIRDPKEERLGWPEDRVLKGVFVTGPYAGIKWVDILDRVVEHGMNAVVLDGKDYEGYLNYPSKAKIAVETKAAQHLWIPDLARAIRFAHWRNIRVIIRIPCFHDPWADKHATDARLSIKFTPTGKPIHVDWLDPTNAEAQNYAMELAQEVVDAGADEVQLDYVRFPVHLSMKVAVLPQPEDRPGIIRDFVKKVHAITQASGAMLSLDFFGVAATGDPMDILKLGQHIPTVAPEADAISLMSYPSHYSKGYMGWQEPADHPEVIAIGNEAAVKQLKPTGAKTVFRTWLQAFPLHVTNYGPAYIAAQAKAADTSGGTGWLMWSPGCEYSAVWGAFPARKK